MSKVICISGTSRGLGKELFASLSELGHKVYGSSRKASGDDPYELRLDITDPKQCERAIQEIVARKDASMC